MTWVTGTANDHLDLLDQLDVQIASMGSCFGLAYSGAGNGRMTGLHGNSMTQFAQTVTVTATSPTSFSVVGSEEGAMGTAGVGTEFTGAVVFTIEAGSIAFEAGDVFTFATAPPWERLRRVSGCSVVATQGNTGMQAVQNILDGKSVADDYRCWRLNAPITIPQDVEFTFREQETIKAYEILGTGVGYLPYSWTFDVYYGGAWHTLDTQTEVSGWTPNGFKHFDVAIPHGSTRYRLHITAIQYPSTLTIGAIRLLREEDSISEGKLDVDAAHACCIWKGKGNDGDSEIFVGVHPFERSDADYFNWELCSFDGYNEQSHFRQQPGFHGKLYLPMWNQGIPYSFVINGRRAIIIAKINAQYELGYLGFHNAYLSPDQVPYPLCIGGSLALGAALPYWDSTSWRWSSSGNNHVSPTHSDPHALNGDVWSSQLRVRGLDGIWVPLEAFWNGAWSTPPADGMGIILPYRCGMTNLDVNLDGSYALWPIMLSLAGPTTMGELDGISAVTGQGLTAETLIRVGAIDLMVINNVNRNDRDDFLAVALD